MASKIEKVLADGPDIIEIKTKMRLVERDDYSFSIRFEATTGEDLYIRFDSNEKLGKDKLPISENKKGFFTFIGRIESPAGAPVFVFYSPKSEEKGKAEILVA